MQTTKPLTDEIGAPRGKRPIGRPRMYASNAEKYAAYREKQKAKGLHEVRSWVPDTPVAPSPVAAVSSIAEVPLSKDAGARATQRRVKVGLDLTRIMDQQNLSRKAVAQLAGLHPTAMSRPLTGEGNLTLNALSRLCEALGYDFDIVFRRPGSAPALQPWQVAPRTPLRIEDINKQCQTNTRNQA